MNIVDLFESAAKALINASPAEKEQIRHRYQICLDLNSHPQSTAKEISNRLKISLRDVDVALETMLRRKLVIRFSREDSIWAVDRYSNI